jgi:hypothetical protein
MVERFEVGKYYRCIVKERRVSWSDAGKMDFVLDGKPRKCLRIYGGATQFEGHSEAWFWCNNEFEEVAWKRKPVTEFIKGLLRKDTYRIGDGGCYDLYPAEVDREENEMPVDSFVNIKLHDISIVKRPVTQFQQLQVPFDLSAVQVIPFGLERLGHFHMYPKEYPQGIFGSSIDKGEEKEFKYKLIDFKELRDGVTDSIKTKD